jgi:hypothetical protein
VRQTVGKPSRQSRVSAGLVEPQTFCTMSYTTLKPERDSRGDGHVAGLVSRSRSTASRPCVPPAQRKV